MLIHMVSIICLKRFQRIIKIILAMLRRKRILNKVLKTNSNLNINFFF